MDPSGKFNREVRIIIQVQRIDPTHFNDNLWYAEFL